MVKIHIHFFSKISWCLSLRHAWWPKNILESVTTTRDLHRAPDYFKYYSSFLLCPATSIHHRQPKDLWAPPWWKIDGDLSVVLSSAHLHSSVRACGPAHFHGLCLYIPLYPQVPRTMSLCIIAKILCTCATNCGFWQKQGLKIWNHHLWTRSLLSNSYRISIIWNRIYFHTQKVEMWVDFTFSHWVDTFI